MSRKQISVYWAAPLFSLADRIFNREMAKRLRAMHYNVILPQEQSMEGYPSNLKILARSCRDGTFRSDIVLAMLEGPDPDSGTSLEVGLKHGVTGKVIGIRTDLRGIDGEILNAMFQLCDEIIYQSSLESEDLDALAEAIHPAIQRVLRPPVP